MLRPWPTPHYAPSTLAALSLLLACSTTDVPADTEAGTSSGTTEQTTQSSNSDPTFPTTGTEPSTSTATTDEPTGGSTSDPSTATDTTVATTDDTLGTTTDATTGTSTGDTTGDTSTGDTEGTSSTGEPDETCEDGLLNQDETDIDCGGGCPAACPDGAACLVNDDCSSNDCQENICSSAACDDGQKNGSETDIDCGGAACPACSDAAACLIDLDCESGVCVDDICQGPTCSDAVQNGGETDLDCGGPDCAPCGDGQACVIDVDCDSGVCTVNTCTAANCFDELQNGEETGVDCGGPACAPCQLETLILNEIDYDQPGTDTAEFVEIFNNTGAPVDLANLELRLVNGSNKAVYTTVKLAPAGVLAQGQYLVVGPAGLVLPPDTAFVPFVGVNNLIQNGDPDGLALVDVANKVVLDAFSYGGSITEAVLGAPFAGATSLVEGEVFPANVKDNADPSRSLARIPNGNDKNNAATDWAATANVTPGAANKP